MEHLSDRLSPFVATSAALHVGLFVVVVFAPSLFPARSEPSWGSSTDKGIKVGVMSSMPGIPLPSPRVAQETAKGNDSKTLNPAEVVPKAPEKASPADLKIPSGTKKPTKADSVKEPVDHGKSTPEPTPVASNAIPGGGGQLALPYGSVNGGTGPATFGDSSFGTRFPDYVTSMTNAIRSKWQDSIVGVARGASPRVYVKFTIDRRGKVSNLEIDQTSGLSQLDRSAQRAVLEAPLPPLPAAYSGSSVDVRFYFEYAR